MNDMRALARIAALGLIAWALVHLVVGAPTAASLVASLVVAWVAHQRSAASSYSLGRSAALAALPLCVLLGTSGEWLDTDLLRGIPHHLGDRLRAQGSPSFAPHIIFDDHPQEFIIHAPGAEQLSARFDFGAPLRLTSLGAGYFRARYNPRHDGAPTWAGQHAVIIDQTKNGELTRTLRHVQTIRRGPHPRFLRAAPSGAFAATVSMETDELIIVDDEGVVRFGTGDGPSDCIVLDDERILVTHAFLDASWVLRRFDGRVLRRLTGLGGHRLARSEGGRIAIVQHDGLELLEPDLTHHQRIELASPDWAGFTDELTLVVSSLRNASLVRLRQAQDDWQASTPLPLGRPPVSMLAEEGGAWVSVTAYAPEGPHLGNHFVQDQLLHVDVDAWRITEQRITGRRSEQQGSAGNLDHGVSPMQLVHHEGGLEVVFAGTEDTGRFAEGVPEYEATPGLFAPVGLAYLASGARLISSPSRGAIGIRRGDEWTLFELDESREPARHAQRRGEHSFFEATRSGVSCQSCHLHGDSDFVMRNIGGQRLAPTSGVGGITGTAPYLRDASYPRIRDLNHLPETLLRGYARADSRRGVDLEAYIAALPRRRTPRRHEDLERVRRGAEVFVDAQCTLCHENAVTSHLGQIALGTLFPSHASQAQRGYDEVLDTPSLLSVGTRGPYLDDGRAPTLLSVFKEHNEDDRHGHTIDLNDTELEDLVHFLEAL